MASFITEVVEKESAVTPAPTPGFTQEPEQ